MAFRGAGPTSNVITDFAYIDNNGKQIAIFAASTDNDLALVDLADPMNVVKLQLTPNEESTGGRSRSVEWAVGTNYVWIGGSVESEQYVVELGATLSDAKVLRTVTGVQASSVIYIENYEARRLANQVSVMLERQPSGDSDDDAALILAIIAMVVCGLTLIVGLYMYHTVMRRLGDDGAKGDKSLASKSMA